MSFGKDDPPSSTTSTVTQQTQLSPEQQRLLSSALPIAQQSLANPGALKYPSFDTVANFNDNQVSAQNNLMSQASGMMNVTNPAMMNALLFGMDPQKVFMNNPALQSAISAAQRPLVENFTSSILPNIRTNAASSGGYGDSRQGIAEGIASRTLTQQLGDIGATMSNQAFDTSMETFGRTMALAPGIMQATTFPSQIQSAVGGQQQQQAQNELDALVQKYFTDMMLPLSMAQNVAGMAFGMPGTNVATTTAPTGVSGGNPLMQGLGGAATGASLATMLGTSTPWGAAIGGLLGLFG